ncbi:MAG TPA: hypothetical protein PLR99_23385 [Polyangiaceae bacterium]|nr:hypothetical protein [Polyangiaceae bacterium]
MPFAPRARLAVAASLVSLSALGCGPSSPPAATDAAAPADAAPPVPQLPRPSGAPLSWPIDALGPYNVGHRSFDVTYAPPAGPARTIPVELWYPTLDTDGDHPLYGGLIRDPDVFEGAQVAPPHEPRGYPVHVYSHGSAGFAGTSGKMARWFASHGWVYVAPNHVGNLLRDGDKKRPLAISYLRSTDLTAALDAVERLAPPDPLAGKLLTKRVLLSGHSFGAFTTWASGGVTFDAKELERRCASDEFSAPCSPEDLAVFAKGLNDPRFAALVPMAGGLSASVSDYDAPKRPTLLMSGSADVSAGPIFEKTQALDVTWLEFEGGCHQLFALGGCSAFEETEGWRLVNVWAFAFGRRTILGDASARTTEIVTGSAPLSSRIRYNHKGTLTPPTDTTP